MDVESLQRQSIEMFLRLNVEVGTLLNEHGPRQGHFGMPSPFAAVQKGWLNYTSCLWNTLPIQSFNCSTAPANCTSCCIPLKLAKHCHPYFAWCFENESNMRVVQQLRKSCLSGNKHCAVGNVAALKHNTCKPFAANASEEKKKLDDGWPESIEEQSLLLLVWKDYIRRQYVKDV